jgi:hypothetical protein
MKVNFSNHINFIPTWNGNEKLPPTEQIKATLQTMQFGDFMEAISSFPKNDDDGNVKTQKLVLLMSKFLPKYASVSGLNDSAGEVDIQRILTFPYYLQLGIELLMQIINSSTPSAVDEKN